MKLKTLATALLGGMLTFSSVAAEMTKPEVEKIVREYLISNPEILIEMSNALRAKQEAQQGEADKELLKKHANQLFQQADDPVTGNPKGSLTIVEFVDYNCGYCKRLAKDLQKLDNVTIYTFLYPILSEDSVKKSRQIWCASDRAKVWNDWMIDGKAPSGKEDCDVSAVNNNRDYGAKLNISGTPTIFFADGTRVPGAMPLQQIEQKLSGAK